MDTRCPSMSLYSETAHPNENLTQEIKLEVKEEPAEEDWRSLHGKQFIFLSLSLSFFYFIRPDILECSD